MSAALPYLKRPVSLFARANKPAVLDQITVETALKWIYQGKYRLVIADVRKATSKDERKRIKGTLPGVTWSGRFSYRNNTSLVEHSGLICLDFDKVGDADAVEAFKAELKADEHVLAAFDSPTWTGLKVLIPVEPAPTSDAEHKQAFAVLTSLYAMPTLDPDNDVARLCYLSFDEALHVKRQARPVQVSYQAPTPKKHRTPDAEKSAVSIEEVERALSFIPPNPEYAEWVKITLAVWRSVGKRRAVAVDLLQAWSPEDDERRYGKKIDSASDEDTRNGSDKVRWGTLKRLAEAHGFAPDAPAQTDLGNAERLAADHGEEVRYVWPLKSWYIYIAGRWARDENGAIIRLAKATVRAMKQADGMAKHAHKTEAAPRLEAMVKLARSEPGIALMPSEMDTDPLLFNVANGTLDLRTGILQAHDRTHLLTKISPVRYDPSARCPTWHAFLDRIMDGNEDLINYLQRLVGYSLTGLILEQIIAMLYGNGANGKTTLLETIRFVVGDYGMHTPTTTLMVRRSDGASNDLARLRGARFVSAVETGDGKRLDEALIKQVTGGEPVPARFLYGEFFEYHPQFKLFLATNHKPEIRGTDEAIWRRIHLVPFNVRIPKDEQDRHLLGKLKAEAAGILVWALEGCLDWQKGGLQAPALVTQATEVYRAEMDVLAGFIDECCEVDWPGSTVPEKKASTLYAAYKSWAERAGEKVETSTKFGTLLVERGFERVRKKDGKYYRGITLKMDDVR